METGREPQKGAKRTKTGRQALLSFALLAPFCGQLFCF
jgi:hypothetical protein